MILGALSVTMANSQQQAVGKLNDALTVRLWLSRGRPTRYFLVPGRHADPRNENKYHQSVFKELPLESSMTSLKIVAMPRRWLCKRMAMFGEGQKTSSSLSCKVES